MGIAAVGAVAVGTAAYSASQSAKASKNAAKAQTQASDQAVAEQRRQYDAMVKLLQPYVSAGSGALDQQRAILGLKGENFQKNAIKGIESSPYFKSVAQQGENAILQNASATGGLRGGNTQGALAQFRPGLLNQLVQQQYQNLGGITSLGQNSAAQSGNAGMQSANSIGNLLSQGGAAKAGGIIGAQNAQNQFLGQLGQLGGLAIGSGAF